MSGHHVPAVPGDAAEVGPLASELARAHRRMVALHAEHYELSAADADARARGADSTPEQAVDDLARIQDQPPDQVSWFDLNRVACRNPEAAADLWQVITVAARDELTSGHRAAQALEWGSTPWRRAQFLAIRDSLRADTPPQSGLEALLIDAVAEAYSSWLALTGQATILAATEVELERDDIQQTGRWRPPHAVMAAEIARVEQRAERAHQRMLRSVKALTELRRSSQTIYVASAGQVNVGQQQVNVAQQTDGTDSDGEGFSK